MAQDTLEYDHQLPGEKVLSSLGKDKLNEMKSISQAANVTIPISGLVRENSGLRPRNLNFLTSDLVEYTAKNGEVLPMSAADKGG